MNTDVESIAGVTQFVAVKDGSLYKMRFSLVDNDNVASASDADVAYGIMDKDNRQLLYNDTFQINASDFQQYQLILTGAPIHAYAWQVETQDLPLSPGECMKYYWRSYFQTAKHLRQQHHSLARDLVSITERA